MNTIIIIIFTFSVLLSAPLDFFADRRFFSSVRFTRIMYRTKKIRISNFFNIVLSLFLYNVNGKILPIFYFSTLLNLSSPWSELGHVNEHFGRVLKL